MKPKALLCVLDWGLGHATRSLALYRVLQSENIDVVVASSGKALAALKLELPDGPFYDLPSYDIDYKGASFMARMISQLPHIRRVIERESQLVAEIVAQEKPDAIISDCRYGCYHPDVRSIFLSHHLKIRLEGIWRPLQGLINLMHKKMIRRFDEYWVPDFPDRSLSGELSKLSIEPMTFIGPLSTMRKSSEKLKTRYHLLAVVSGPEPERKKFADMVSAQVKSVAGPCLVVHGLPDVRCQRSESDVTYMKRDELNQAMENADVVIARSGYSTVMDAAALGTRMIFVPTPGQTEQLYLAKRLTENGIAFSQRQDKFNLNEAIEQASRFQGFPKKNGQVNELVVRAVRTLKIQR